MRSVKFTNGEFYHLYNRGVEARSIFNDDGDRRRFLIYLRELNVLQKTGQSISKKIGTRTIDPTPLLSIHQFCLMNNHYHLLVSQHCEKGISTFMQRLGTGYTKFFNKKYDRRGHLFEKRYQAEHVDSSEYFLQLSAYIHFNPYIYFDSNYGTHLETYPWSSMSRYKDWDKKDRLLDRSYVKQFFTGYSDYKHFVLSRLTEHIERKHYEAQLRKALLPSEA